MCHAWSWLSSKWNNTRSREPEVSHKSHLVPRGRQLEHMPIFRVGWIQFIHIHPKNIMQHIAEEVVGEEQAEATFKSLHWELLRSWMRGVDEGGVTFICSGVDEPGGGSWSCTAATPLSTEHHCCNFWRPRDTLRGTHRGSGGWYLLCVSLEGKDYSSTNLGNMLTLTLAYKNVV